MDALSTITKKKEVKKTSSVPAVSADSSLKGLIDNYATEKKAFKEIESRVGELEVQVRAGAEKLLDKEISQNSFTKSVTTKGNAAEIRVTRSDRFSVSGEEVETHLVDALGPKFDQNFEVAESIQIKASVLINEDTRKKFLEKFTAEEIEQFFEGYRSVKTKKGFDEKQFDLTSKERDKIAPFVKQAKASISVIS